MSTENAENVQMNVSESGTTPETTQQKQVDVNTPVNVTLQLLLNFRNIVDVSTSRGTFKSNELSSIGRVYDELVLIINKAVQDAPNQAESTESNTSSE
tara:strand:- start:1 stop:294 length:294 start_codon:yes stop_codon:yes gene_type:complete